MLPMTKTKNSMGGVIIIMGGVAGAAMMEQTGVVATPTTNVTARKDASAQGVPVKCPTAPIIVDVMGAIVKCQCVPTTANVPEETAKCPCVLPTVTVMEATAPGAATISAIVAEVTAKAGHPVEILGRVTTVATE